ncbi:MAG: DUF3604 domain-containing protein, partial [Acidobacteria bacterium]|nr:DUF3604 domain-containing protein [Acidobacteriota bacterium]
PALEPQRRFILTPGVIADIKGNESTRMVIEANGARLVVEPFALKAGQVRNFGAGISAERVATAQRITGSESDADFASVLAHPSGELWTAWVAFANGRNEVWARRFDGRTWDQPRKITDAHNDCYQVKLARDRNGHIWFIWAAQVNGNFDLYARRWTGSQLTSTERLTADEQPDVNHSAATDSAGNVWVVWQGFRSGRSDIFARRFDGSAWSPAEKVSESPANDWMPAIATDGQGSAFVAWDTYDRGNYDVMARRWRNGQWSEVIAVATTPKFEAYVTLACDKSNRVWAAWNESGFEWGKDSGFLVKREGAPLYNWRTVNVAVWDGQWKTPAAPFEASMPKHLQGYNDMPVLQSDGTGRIWLFFRHRLLRIQDLPPDTPAHRAAWEIYATAYEGFRWSEPVTMPFSGGRQDVRTGFATGAPGTLYAAYSTDHRDFEDFLYQRSAVYAARVPVPAAAADPPQLNPRPPVELKAFPVQADEVKDLARIRGETWTVDGKTYKIYRGDTHRHTEFSMDGNNDGSLIDAYRYAIDAASLDYLMVSDHNGLGGPDNAYPNWLLQQAVDLYHLPGTFVPLYGYERSVGYPNGHRNVIFAKRGNPTLPIPPAENQGREGAAKLYEYLKKYGGIAISHTSASNMGTDWRDNDPEVEPLVEIYQGDRVSAEYEGAPKAAYGGNLASAPGGFRPAGYVWNAWAKGYKLGVQVASDHLSTHISYACTVATEFTRQGLIDAMKLRHSYGATDNIVLDYRMDAAGKQHLQGETIKLPKGRHELVVNIKGTKPIRQIDIVRDNKFIHTRHPLTQDESFRFVDAEPLTAKVSYYYVRVQQVDEQIAWSSPVWISR